MTTNPKPHRKQANFPARFSTFGTPTNHPSGDGFRCAQPVLQIDPPPLLGRPVAGVVHLRGLVGEREARARFAAEGDAFHEVLPLPKELQSDVGHGSTARQTEMAAKS
jgi:hypothetical protein